MARLSSTTPNPRTFRVQVCSDLVSPLHPLSRLARMRLVKERMKALQLVLIASLSIFQVNDNNLIVYLGLGAEGRRMRLSHKSAR